MTKTAMLRALLRRVPQPRQGRAGQSGEWRAVESGSAERSQTETEGIPAVAVAPDQVVHLERNRKPVRRRPRQPGGADELTEALRPVRQCREHVDRLVEHADAAYTAFHSARLSSHYLGAPTCQHPAR